MKGFEYLHKQGMRLIAVLAFLFAATMCYLVVTGGITPADFFGTSSIIMATVAAVNINGNPNAPLKAGKLIKAKLYYIIEDQVDDSVAFPSRSGRTIGNIPLKSGEYWHYINTVSITNPDLAISGTLGDAGGTLTSTLKAVLGGVDDNTLNLIESYMGKGMYVVFEVCATGTKYLLGTGCRPAILQAPEGGFAAEASSITLTWLCESAQLFSIYDGNLPTLAPASIAANAITVALTSNPQFKFASGTANTELANVTAIADADAGRVVTFIGGGGSGPSKIVTGGNILLIGGAAWTGNDGAQISFRIFKTTSSAFSLIEITGTRL